MSIEVHIHLLRDAFELKADFTIPDRGVTALFGPSGSGKTLTLRAMAGLERAPGGYLRVGEDVWQDESDSVPTHLRGAGFVFQEASLFRHLSVRRNLEYAVRRAPGEPGRLSLEHAAELLDVTPLLDRRPDRLSGGERQRVAIARTLLSEPRILFMDEPLASLDRGGKDEILPFLERLFAELETPVLYVSHAADEVAQLADHMVLLERGSVLATGPIHEMLTRLDLPLALGRDAESLIETRVIGYDDADGLATLEFEGGRIAVPSHALPIGRTVRVRLRAQDVSLTLEQHADTSILNILPATVDAVSESDGAQVTVRLLSGGMPILARVTRRSCDRLGLAPRLRVFAQIKSVALLA